MDIFGKDQGERKPVSCMSRLYELLNSADVDLEKVKELFLGKSGKIRSGLAKDTLAEVYEQVSQQGLGTFLVKDEQVFWSNFNRLVVDLGIYESLCRRREYRLGASGTVAIGNWVWKTLEVEPGTKIVAQVDPFKREVVLKPE